MVQQNTDTVTERVESDKQDDTECPTAFDGTHEFKPMLEFEDHSLAQCVFCGKEKEVPHLS